MNTEWPCLYATFLAFLLGHLWLRLAVAAGLIALLVTAAPVFLGGKQIFLPNMDDGRIRINVIADPGIPLDYMDADVKRLEELFLDQPETATVFTIVGGRIDPPGLGAGGRGGDASAPGCHHRLRPDLLHAGDPGADPHGLRRIPVRSRHSLALLLILSPGAFIETCFTGINQGGYKHSRQLQKIHLDN